MIKQGNCTGKISIRARALLKMVLFRLVKSKNKKLRLGYLNLGASFLATRNLNKPDIYKLMGVSLMKGDEIDPRNDP